jgi:hypothetical protein
MTISPTLRLRGMFAGMLAESRIKSRARHIRHPETAVNIQRQPVGGGGICGGTWASRNDDTVEFVGHSLIIVAPTLEDISLFIIMLNVLLLLTSTNLGSR